MSSFDEISALARAAGMRDLAAAKKLVRALERDVGPSLTRDSWVRIPEVDSGFPLKVEPSLRGRGAVVTLDDDELPREILEPWCRESFSELETAIKVHLHLLKGGFPIDAVLVAAWQDLAWRASRFIFLHPSFELTPGGNRYPEWHPRSEAVDA